MVACFVAEIGQRADSGSGAFSCTSPKLDIVPDKIDFGPISLCCLSGLSANQKLRAWWCRRSSQGRCGAIGQLRALWCRRTVRGAVVPSDSEGRCVAVGQLRALWCRRTVKGAVVSSDS